MSPRSDVLSPAALTLLTAQRERRDLRPGWRARARLALRQGKATNDLAVVAAAAELLESASLEALDARVRALEILMGVRSA